MTGIRCLVVCLCLVVLCAGAFASSGRNTLTLFVAVDGNDAWSGLRAAPNHDDTDGPLATLTAARDAVRKLRAEGRITQPVRVLLRGGTHFIEEPLVFEPQDSGTELLPITYMSYPGEQAVVSGGREITGWLKRSTGAWVVSIPEVRWGGWQFRNLFVNGEERPVARVPAEQCFELSDMRGVEVGEDSAKATFTFEPGDLSTEWQVPHRLRVVVYDDRNEVSLAVESLCTDTNTVVLSGMPGWPFTDDPSRLRYYVEDLREALAEPGQWFLGPIGGRLTYLPLPGECACCVSFVAPVSPQFLVFAGNPAEQQYVQHIQVRDIAFHYAGFPLDPVREEAPAAIELVGARDCAIENCEIGYIGGRAILEGEGSEGNSLDSNRIFAGKRMAQ